PVTASTPAARMGAKPTSDSSPDETVSRVDIGTDETEMTTHKRVIEAEMKPAESPCGSPGSPESCEAVPDLLDLLPVEAPCPAGSCDMAGRQRRGQRECLGDPVGELDHVLAPILRMSEDLVGLGDIARMSLDEEPAAVCHHHHGVIVEAWIDPQRFGIVGHLHPTVDMSLDVVIETVADDPASLSSSLVDRPPVAAIVGDETHPGSDPEELRTEGAVRV